MRHPCCTLIKLKSKLPLCQIPILFQPFPLFYIFVYCITFIYILKEFFVNFCPIIKLFVPLGTFTSGTFCIIFYYRYFFINLISKKSSKCPTGKRPQWDTDNQKNVPKGTLNLFCKNYCSYIITCICTS